MAAPVKGVVVQPKKSTSPLKIIAIIGGVLVVICAIVLVVMFVIGKKVVDNLPTQTVEAQLEAAAQVANQACPLMIDESTRMVSVTYVAPRTLRYNYELVGYSASDLNIETFTSLMEPSIISNLKTQSTVQWMLDNQVTFLYVYTGEDGLPITTITITPDKYAE